MNSGNRAAVLENTALRVTVLPGSGGDIVELLHKPSDTQFLWQRPGAPQGEATQARARGEFLDQYVGGWHEMLPNFGPGRLHGAEFGLCGEATLLDWDLEVERDAPEETCLRLDVGLRRLPLRLTKRLSLRAEEPTLQIEETLRNEGAQEIDFTWGHHPAIGPGFLSPSCVIELPKRRILATGPGGENAAIEPGTEGSWPLIAAADGSELDLSRVRPYTPGWEEDLCMVDVEEAWVGVTDRGRELGFGLAWERDVFPNLWIWQNFGGRFDHPWYGTSYCLGLEPLSSFPFDIEDVLRAGTQRSLGAGEELTTRLCATVYRPSGRLVGIDLEGRTRFEP
jgi:hypothetical protein